MQIKLNDGSANWIAEYDIPSQTISSIRLENPAEDEFDGEQWPEFTAMDRHHYNDLARAAYEEFYKGE